VEIRGRSVTQMLCPVLSVVLVTPDDYETIRRTMEHLRSQTIANRMEIVLVAPGDDSLKTDEAELTSFHCHSIVELEEVSSVAVANAAGVRAASAPIVAFVEEHSFPDAQWAEALVEAHDQRRSQARGWVAVGPVVENANPETLVSWADFLKAYGSWMGPTQGGPVDHLPGHNSSYRRSILMQYDRELEAMLEAESVLHWDMRSRGYQLYLEPAAKVAHLNFGLLSSWLPPQYHSGRCFAARRAKAWSPARRLVYTVGAPLIPAVRWWRIMGQARRSGLARALLVRVSPILLLGLAASALGEMLGYAFGPGTSVQRIAAWEFHRAEHQPRAGRRKWS
jgi:hypothetical protein